ncbi:DNA topoisomerase [Xanthomonas campestris]|uniref:DNA topoisomerase n=1 Tax=Xanthomonas campestris TaxID=339 RepID=UPI00202B5318|nr:DNA topoisomerase [Xanthomonas campestris]
MNLSRAYTLRSRAAGGKGPRHVGRVMSPTLALVVRRDAAIEAFREATYYELEITAQTALGASVVLTHAPADAGGSSLAPTPKPSSPPPPELVDRSRSHMKARRRSPRP